MCNISKYTRVKIVKFKEREINYIFYFLVEINILFSIVQVRGKGSNLEQAHVNSEWKHKSSSFIPSKLWNKLPITVRKKPYV